MSVLERINSCKDVKDLSLDEMNELASDIRKGILNRVNKIGGHLGPDLGIVEATIALHYVFDCPYDQFVFDVSHQCYPHKMLTGRKDAFINNEKLADYSGYFAPIESPCDPFIIGHTSTSISLACGLAKARDLRKEKFNVIALIGDGSLSGGEAYEGLNNAAVLKSNFIAIVNDNEMSIAKNQGGLYKNLEELRKTKGEAQNNFFKTLGFDYIYIEEGNNIEVLINEFKKIKDIKRPIVVHIHTLKGKGYKPAEKYKENYHWQLPGFMDKKQNKKVDFNQTYESITTDFLLRKKMEGEHIAVINPATPGAVGFSEEFRKAMGDNYTDTGIAEEHAIAYASALARGGAKPVLAILSSFVQRTYDQLSQDLALNNSPATILVYWGAISNADCTHLGVFDIPLISNIPNIVYLSPTNKEEYLAMLEYSINQESHPTVIRVPFGTLRATGIKDKTDYSILNKFKMNKKGSAVAIIAAGNFYALGEEVSKLLEEKYDIHPTLINPCFLSGVDCDMLNKLKLNHKLVITLEDGVISGGFGEKISRFYSSSDMKVLNFGADKVFTDRIALDELYNKYHLTKELIVEDIIKILEK